MVRNYFLLFVLLLGVAIVAKAESDLTKHSTSAGNFTFADKYSLENVTQAAQKLRKEDSNFQYMSVAQCHKTQYCIYFLYNNTGSDNSNLVKLVEKYQKEYGKSLVSTSIGPADVLCMRDCK